MDPELSKVNITFGATLGATKGGTFDIVAWTGAAICNAANNSANRVRLNRREDITLSKFKNKTI
jgi:hypothetical protein